MEDSYEWTDESSNAYLSAQSGQGVSLLRVGVDGGEPMEC